MNQTRLSTDECTPSVGSIYFDPYIQAVQVTPEDELEERLRTLDAHKGEWARLGSDERLRLLGRVREDFWALREAWVQAEMEAKGVPPGSFGETEEWVMYAQVLRALRTIQRALIDIRDRGRPALPGLLTCGPGGRVVARVFPHTLADRLTFLGVRGEVWFEEGVTEADVRDGQAARYQSPPYPGAVSLVLGAGNASMLPVCDALHKLFVDLQVVVLKMNPVNAHLGPLIAEGLRALIERGYLAVVYGGSETGAALADHPLVEALHMTGSDKAYEAVVFGPGAEGQARKAERAPRNAKPFTSELGSVSPVIVVPGPWSQRDVEEQAKHIATWLTLNAGFACLTPRMLVQHAAWPQRKALDAAIRRDLGRCPTRVAYYPGARETHAIFLAAHPQADCLGEASDGQLPWTLVPDLDPEDADEICFKREAFCSLTGQTALLGEGVEDYLQRAVDFCNDTLWGSLCATLIVHPATLRDPALAAAVERAIARLRYGTVSVNLLAFYGTYFMVTPWGAPPGHEPCDIQSGMGKNFNFSMFERPAKTVLRAPFRRFDPLTVHSRRTGAMARRMAAFEAAPSPIKFARLLWSALRA
jgi:hypothetical protein